MNNTKPRVFMATMHHITNETIHWGGNSDPEVELPKRWDTHFFVSKDEVSVKKFD